MAINVTKPSVNLREKLNELETNKGLKGNEILQAETAQEVRSLIGAGRKNLIINGGFDVWQRGTSFSGTSAQYTADRWTTWTTLDISVDKTSDGALLTHPSTESLLEYRMEDKDTAKVRGNTVTLSVEATLGTSIGCQLYLYARNSSGGWYWGGGAAQRVVVDSSGKHSATFDIPDDVGIDTLRLRISNHNTVAYQSGTITIHTVQLELGSVATDFEHRSYGEELALCQRYFCHSGGDGVIPSLTTGPSGTHTHCLVVDIGDGSIPSGAFPVEMRANPTITSGRLYTYNWGVYKNVTYANATKGGIWRIGHDGGYSTGTPYWYVYIADAEL